MQSLCENTYNSTVHNTHMHSAPKACQSVSIDLYLCKYETIETKLLVGSTQMNDRLCARLNANTGFCVNILPAFWTYIVALFTWQNRCNTSLNNAQSHFEMQTVLFLPTFLSWFALLYSVLFGWFFLCTQEFHFNLFDNKYSISHFLCVRCCDY